jgi:hypothetical protein
MTPFVLVASTLLGAGLSASPTEPVTTQAKGGFDVEVIPQQVDNAPAKAAQLGRLSIDKRFHGDLEAVSQGEMLASGNGSHAGAYVALEKVTGTLDGHKGSFYLLHSAVMVGGQPQDWRIHVVPESGTAGLAGLSGRMAITITADGGHHYTFDYTLPRR